MYIVSSFFVKLRHLLIDDVTMRCGIGVDGWMTMIQGRLAMGGMEANASIFGLGGFFLGLGM